MSESARIFFDSMNTPYMNSLWGFAQGVVLGIFIGVWSEHAEKKK